MDNEKKNTGNDTSTHSTPRSDKPAPPLKHGSQAPESNPDRGTNDNRTDAGAPKK